jgi:hypothetical protein
MYPPGFAVSIALGTYTMFTRTFLFTVMAVFVATNALAQAVAPGQMISGGPVNVRAPESIGWRRVESSGPTLAFARKGVASNDSYLAQVTLFALGETKSHEEFVALIKTAAEADASPDRFKTIESSFEYTEERGYPCVRAKSLTEDAKAKTGFFSRENLKLQAFSLYCRHPKRSGLAFVAVYSHRGGELDSDLESQAKSFIAGVQLPEP